jgi:hypothetical protein
MTPQSQTLRKWYSGMSLQEDWWAVWLGLTFFSLGLLSITGVVQASPQDRRGFVVRDFYLRSFRRMTVPLVTP